MIGVDVDELDVALMVRVAVLVALVLLALAVATGEVVGSLVAAPVSLVVIWRLLTPGADPETDED